MILDSSSSLSSEPAVVEFAVGIAGQETGNRKGGGGGGGSRLEAEAGR